MIMSMKMESLCNRKNRHGIMDEQLMVQDSDHDVSNSSSNITSTTNEEEEEEEDEVSSSGPLQDMTSLLQQLPLKRGLSKHYNGKSQSFTSLLSAGCLEDLAKPENPYNKRLKTCKSYRELPRNNTYSKLIVKKASKTNNNNNNNNNNKDHLSSIFSSLGGGGINGRRYSSFYGNNNRPPIPAVPRISNSTSAASSNQTPLFV